MKYIEFKDIVISNYKSIFPNSACTISLGAFGKDTFFVTYYLAGNQSEFPNGISQNDLFQISFHIMQKTEKYGDGIRLEDDTELPETLVLSVHQKIIKTKPNNEYMAYGNVSLPFRKTVGTPEKIVDTLKVYAEKVKKTLTELYETDALPVNQQPNIKELVASKLGINENKKDESKQVNNMKIEFSKTYNKYQVITPNGKVLEEFDTEKEAVDWASKQKDFIVKKEDIGYDYWGPKEMEPFEGKAYIEYYGGPRTFRVASKIKKW